MKTNELKSLSQRAGEDLFQNILPFWSGPALDREQGGWMAYLSNDLKPDRTQPKGLILNTRILWTFSAVHRARPDPAFKQMADRAFEYLMSRFWDSQHGGAFWRLDDRGSVMDDSKKIYGQAFWIYAFAEYHLAFGVPGALARAQEVFELVERHAHDPAHGGYLEVRRRDWSDAGNDARLSDKDLNEKKSMNNHLHILEAYTTLHRAWKEPRVSQRLRELIELFERRILDSRTFHLNHFFDEEWRVRSDTYTFGHDIEGTWLLCEAAEELGDPALFKRVEAVALRMAGVALKEGMSADGGLSYEGKGGKIIDAGREWWPLAEAVVGSLNAYQISGDSLYLDAALKSYDYIQAHLIDRRHGDWFWRISPDGRPDAGQAKMSEWKCPYHNGRMCLEILRRVPEILSSQNTAKTG